MNQTKVNLDESVLDEINNKSKIRTTKLEKLQLFSCFSDTLVVEGRHCLRDNMREN